MTKTLLLAVIAAGCTHDDCDTTDTGPTQSTSDDPTTSSGTPTGDTGTESPELVSDPLHGLPTGKAQWADLCARGHRDSVADAFCEGSTPPVVTSLADLRTQLGLGGDEILGDAPIRLSAVFHSTAVGGRLVTPLNPRAFLMTPPRGRQENPAEPRPDERYTVLAFARGETFVEITSKDVETGEPRFYLFRFSLGCEDDVGGCSLADLYTEGVESGWLDWSLYDDGDVANTTLDCLRCHQPAGPGTERLLLMQELQNPWNHWFYEEHTENIAAIRAFEEAHGDTRYADIPVDLFTRSRPRNLQILIQNNIGLSQPNEYHSRTINEELEEHGTSDTWQALFDASIRGDAKPVPYVDNPHVDGNWDMTTAYQPTIDPTSPVAAAITSTRAVIEGTASPDQMPDYRDLWLPEALLATSFHAQPGLDGPGLLRQMCGQCHNAGVDPSLDRAGFDVDALDVMPRSVKNAAIDRLLLPPEDIRHMPPRRFHELTPAERATIVQTLQQ